MTARASALSRRGESDLPSRYKPANPRRGANHVEPATAFIADFPLGSTLTPEQFDSWAEDHHLLTVPRDVPKQSDTWKAHLQRRNELRYRINKAGTHPRMSEVGQPTFTCDSVHMGLWEVRAPHVAIIEQGLPGQLQSLITTKKRQLKYLIQSADWAALPIHQRIMAEGLYEEIDAFTERITLDTNILDRKFAQFQRRIRQDVDSGIVSRAGVQGFLALDEPPAEPEHG